MRKLALTCIFTLAAALLALPSAQTRAMAGTCDKAATVSARLEVLGRGGISWTLETTPQGDAGVLNRSGGHWHVRVSPEASCDLLVSITNHEWMHTAQLREFPEAGPGTYGDSVEMIADCGSRLLGSTFTPYISMAHRSCSAYELAAATHLIDKYMVTPR